jgi:SAM-dependent methyltransferase
LAPDLATSAEAFDPQAFAALAAVESKHFWFVPRNRLIRYLVESHFPRARCFLEVGCGTGHVLQSLSTIRHWDRLVGAEVSSVGLAQARGRIGPNIELVQLDARSINVRAAFDLIGAFDVLEHVLQDETVLGEVFASLRPGGGAILSVPQHPWLWSPADDLAHHVRRYRRGELEDKARAAGFEILDTLSYTSLLLPLMAVSRLGTRRRHREGLGATQHEWKIAPGLNRVLLHLLSLEVGLTRAGVRFPVGGSRIVVARKPG